METVAMLHRYVNGIFFQSAISRQRFFMNDPAYLAKSQKLSRLQAIMGELCAKMDLLCHYFASAGEDPESVSLAQLITHPFCALRHPGIRENAR